jgi:hypothetical protein
MQALGCSRVELTDGLGASGVSAATMTRAITLSSIHTRARLDRFVADSDRLQITSYLDLLKHPTADPVALGSVCRPYGNERRTTIPNDGHLTVGRSTYRHEWAARQLRRRAARRQRGPILRSIEPQRAPAGVSGWVPPFCCGG